MKFQKEIDLQTNIFNVRNFTSSLIRDYSLRSFCCHNYNMFLSCFIFVNYPVQYQFDKLLFLLTVLSCFVDSAIVMFAMLYNN